jgi:ABC-type glutathione transport system ATPase component
VPNEWTRRFGAIRRAKDRAYLAEAERAIALEERLAVKFAPSEPISFSDGERQRIARAFGRPVK